jgi:CRP-like cAMP-binding protein
MRKPAPTEEQLREEVDVLRRLLLFAGVAPSKLKLLALMSDRVNFDPGETVFKQGKPADAAYVVLSGSADVLVNSPSGKTKVATIEPHSMVGEIAVLCDAARFATVKANTPLETLRIRKDQLVRLLAES